jgi:hypothetical protein
MKNAQILISATTLILLGSPAIYADGQGNPVDLAVLNSLNVEMGSEVDEEALSAIMEMEGAGLESLTTPEAKCDLAMNMLIAADIDPDMMTELDDGDDPTEMLSEAMGDTEAAATLVSGLEQMDADLKECFTNLATSE